MPQNDFVAKYGLDYFDISMRALYEMTKRFTAEGAIRSFIQQYPIRRLPYCGSGLKTQIATSDGSYPRAHGRVCL